MSKDAKIQPGARLRPIGHVVLAHKRPGLPPVERHVPHGPPEAPFDYTVTEGGPPWDLLRKEIRADIAAASASGFEVLSPEPTRKAGEQASKPADTAKSEG